MAIEFMEDFIKKNPDNMEAYNNFKRTPQLDKGSWVIESMTNEGMEIKIVLTEQGKMVTAYPIIQ